MIVIFTGPPSSGKDTIGNMFENRHHNFTKKEFKAPLIRMVKAAFDIDDFLWNRMFNEREKNKAQALLQWKSPRETLISFSEDMMKPIYGKDIFGILCAQEMSLLQNYYVTDGGFKEEIKPLIDKFGEDKIYVIKLNRANTSYEGDSRQPYNPEWFPNVKFKELDNNRSIEEVLDDVDEFVFTP